MPVKVPRARSGVLPKRRPMFKQPIVHTEYVPPKDTGYAEGINHPKGIQRDYKPVPAFPIADRLAKSSAEPAKPLSEAEFKKLSPNQQFKIKNAELRRQYLRESYFKEEQMMKKKAESKAAKEAEESKILHEVRSRQKSDAELLTLPTIESYLKGNLVRPRTEAEKEELKLKREANRVNHELNHKTSLAVQLLELYNQSNNFAVTEEKLTQMIDEAFDESKMSGQEYNKFGHVVVSEISGVPTPKLFEEELTDAILGTKLEGPSYDSVEDTLSGEFGAVLKEADRAAYQAQQKDNEASS